MTAINIDDSTTENTAPAFAALADKWSMPSSVAAPAMLAALDATITSDKAVVVGKYAVPNNLAIDSAVGIPWRIGRVGYGPALRAAIKDAPKDAGMTLAMVTRHKELASAVAALVGVACDEKRDKDGISLSKVRTRVVHLTFKYGGEDCFENLNIPATSENAVAETVETKDGPVRLLVPSGKVSGPCLEASAFKSALKVLMPVTGKVKIPTFPTFTGLVRRGNGVGVASFVEVGDAFKAIAKIGIRAAGTEHSAGLCYARVNKKEIHKACDEKRAAEIIALLEGSMSLVHDMQIAEIRTLLGGGKPCKKTQQATLVANGAAARRLMEKGGLADVAEAFASYGTISAETFTAPVEG